MQPQKSREAFLVKASKDVLGKRVTNVQGEDLGEIKDIVIDGPAARVTYAVLSFGGFLGLGDKLFAVPWLSLNYHAAQDCFVIHADKERLKNAPGFDKGNWPDMSDPTWSTTIDQYYQPKL